MSYILNALRKSERERQAIEPETVTARIVTHQAPRHRGTTGLIAALIVVNLAVLVYFLGFRDKATNDTTQSAVATQPVAAVIKPLESEPAERVPSRRPVERSVKPKESPIARIVAARTEAPVTPPEKPAVVKKQPIEPVIQPEESPTPSPVKPAVATKQPVEPAKPLLAPQQSTVQPEEPPEDDIHQQAPVTAAAPIVEPAPAPAPKPLPVQAKNDLPFLDELPAEFGRSLPDLPINVFSYSSTPAERFIMIDMVKYVPGQRIKDQLELKEIRADSIVVSYDGRTFKIKRP